MFYAPKQPNGLQCVRRVLGSLLNVPPPSRLTVNFIPAYLVWHKSKVKSLSLKASPPPSTHPPLTKTRDPSSRKNAALPPYPPRSP